MVLKKLDRCPLCETASPVPGPRGGSGQNFYCRDRVRCRQGFAVVTRNGQLIWWHPIGEVSDELFKMYEAPPP